MNRVSAQLLVSSVRAAAALGGPVPWAAWTMAAAVRSRGAGQSRPLHLALLREKGRAAVPASPAAVAMLPRAPFATGRPPVHLKIDREHERQVGQELLEHRPPDQVSEASSRWQNVTTNAPRAEPSVGDSFKGEVNSIKDALALTAVPRESYMLGLSGTLPYLFTSLSTVYLGWVLRRTDPTSSPLRDSFVVSHDTAQHWLQMLEPVQLGYGALIISFLGAIHWGLELGETKPSRDRTRFRYAMGILAPAVAWPTLVLPVHFALTGQFLAFVLLFFADSRASALGWAPPWYTTYRLVLTLVVGTAILISLIFRYRIDAGESMAERLHEGREEEYTEKWKALEAQEKARRKKAAEEAAAKAEQNRGAADKRQEDAKDGEDKTDEKSNEQGVDGDSPSKKKAAKGDESAEEGG